MRKTFIFFLLLYIYINGYSLVADLNHLLHACIWAALRRLGVKGVEIRKPEHLDSVSSLIIPGGESTSMAKLAEYHNLFPALRQFVRTGKPVWGTCAGLIFLTDKAFGQKTRGQELVGGLNCTVPRTYFGSQQFFISEPETFRGVFIRASAVLEVAPGVDVLENPVPEKKVVVAVKQGNLLKTAFHPELTADTRWHSYFLKMGSEAQEASSSIVPVGGLDLFLDEKLRINLPIYQLQQ